MSNYQYHRILPANARATYEEFNVVDYELTFPNRALILGSVRLEGEVEVLVDGSKYLNDPRPSTITDAAAAAINCDDLRVQMDGDCGAHAFVEVAQTQISGAVAESLGDYSRWVKMSACAMTAANDNNNSSNVCELKAPRDEITNNILKGEVVATDPDLSTAPTANGGLRQNPDFSIKPRICLNGGQGAVPFSRVGDVRVSFTLARNNSALYGLNMGNKVEYKLRNLRLVYATVPDDGSHSEKAVVMRKLNVKQSINSALANVNVRVPAVCSAVSCSFNVQAQENTPKYNNQVLHPVPNLSSTQFLFNSSTNAMVTYRIRSNAELIDRAIDSFVDADKNNLSTAKLANGNGMMIGLNFDDLVDLSRNAFSLELDSSVSNLVPLVIYMYFHSQLEL